MAVIVSSGLSKGRIGYCVDMELLDSVLGGAQGEIHNRRVEAAMTDGRGTPVEPGIQ